VRGGLKLHDALAKLRADGSKGTALYRSGAAHAASAIIFGLVLAARSDASTLAQAAGAIQMSGWLAEGGAKAAGFFEVGVPVDPARPATQARFERFSASVKVSESARKLLGGLGGIIAGVVVAMGITAAFRRGDIVAGATGVASLLATTVSTAALIADARASLAIVTGAVSAAAAAAPLAALAAVSLGAAAIAVRAALIQLAVGSDPQGHSSAQLRRGRAEPTARQSRHQHS
jgi:hypothetical protein